MDQYLRLIVYYRYGFMVYGLWFMAHEVWLMDYDLGIVDYCLWIRPLRLMAWAYSKL